MHLSFLHLAMQVSSGVATWKDPFEATCSLEGPDSADPVCSGEVLLQTVHHKNVSGDC